MQYKSILFDLDGTLLDTLDDLADSVNAVLNKLGYPGHNREAYKYFVGSGVEHLLKSALPAEHAAKPGMAELVQQFNEEYAQRWSLHTRPYRGIADLLNWLKEKKIPVSILSNKPDYFTRQCVSSLLPGWEFHTVFGARTGIPKKPDPGSCLEIAGKTGIPPAEFLYAGDSGIDMRTAAAAGMHPVGVLWGFREAAELKAQGAEFLVKNPGQIIDIFLGKALQE